jgi:hypothetical protein
MELLYEHARPEPRLRRLLGHVGIYEHASRLHQERMQESILYFDREEEKMGENESRQSRPVGTSFTEARPVRTFSNFQALIQSKLEHQQLCDVTATEVTGGKDESDESGESEESADSEAGESDDDDHDDSIFLESEHAVIKRDEFLKKALSLGDGDDLAREMSRCTITKGKQIDDDQMWEQQQRVLTQSESEEAFYNVGLG